MNTTIYDMEIEVTDNPEFCNLDTFTRCHFLDSSRRHCNLFLKESESHKIKHPLTYEIINHQNQFLKCGPCKKLYSHFGYIDNGNDE